MVETNQGLQMTREEAYLEEEDIERIGLMLKLSSTKEIAEDINEFLINKIYDSFKNQKCNNCIFLIHDKDGSFSQCSILDEISVNYNFGCNKWQPKKT